MLLNKSNVLGFAVDTMKYSFMFYIKYKTQRPFKLNRCMSNTPIDIGHHPPDYFYCQE